MIVDDGWQTLDSKRGYAFTGDWKPERIPEMKRFVDAVHERGMKILLWYAMSLVGERSESGRSGRLAPRGAPRRCTTISIPSRPWC